MQIIIVNNTNDEYNITDNEYDIFTYTMHQSIFSVQRDIRILMPAMCIHLVIYNGLRSVGNVLFIVGWGRIQLGMVDEVGSPFESGWNRIPLDGYWQWVEVEPVGQIVGIKIQRWLPLYRANRCIVYVNSGKSNKWFPRRKVCQ